jgi:hypothetical protein
MTDRCGEDVGEIFRTIVHKELKLVADQVDCDLSSKMLESRLIEHFYQFS